MRSRLVIGLQVVLLIVPLVWFFWVFGPSLTVADWVGLGLVLLACLAIGVFSLLPLYLRYRRLK